MVLKKVLEVTMACALNATHESVEEELIKMLKNSGEYTPDVAELEDLKTSILKELKESKYKESPVMIETMLNIGLSYYSSFVMTFLTEKYMEIVHEEVMRKDEEE